MVAAAATGLLLFTLIHFRDVESDGTPETEVLDDGKPGSHPSKPTQQSHRDEPTSPQGEAVRRKVRSLLDIKKGEVAVILLPSVALEEWFKLVEPAVDGASELEQGIVGLYSGSQLTPILERILSEKHRLPAKFGNASDFDWAARGIESIEVEDKGRISDLTIRYRNSGSSSISQTGISVFNGHGVLLRTVSAHDSSGFIIMTSSGTDPTEE